jgi:hypothetical protein
LRSRSDPARPCTLIRPEPAATTRFSISAEPSAQARGFALDGAARLIPAERTRIEIARFSAQRGGDRLALAGPAAITLDDGSALIENLVVAAGSGRIRSRGPGR